MSRMRHLVIALVIAALWPMVALGAAECGPEPIRPPVKISGAFCGRLFEISGPVFGDRNYGGAELYLADDKGDRTTIRADLNGNFKFPALPKGHYTLYVPGFQLTWREIELTNGRAPTCTRPVSVHLQVGGEPCGTWIEDRRPSRD